MWGGRWQHQQQQGRGCPQLTLPVRDHHRVGWQVAAPAAAGPRVPPAGAPHQRPPSCGVAGGSTSSRAAGAPSWRSPSETTIVWGGRWQHQQQQGRGCPQLTLPVRDHHRVGWQVAAPAAAGPRVPPADAPHQRPPSCGVAGGSTSSSRAAGAPSWRSPSETTIVWGGRWQHQQQQGRGCPQLTLPVRDHHRVGWQVAAPAAAGPRVPPAGAPHQRPPSCGVAGGSTSSSRAAGAPSWRSPSEAAIVWGGRWQHQQQ